MKLQRILVVDDDKSARTLVKINLKQIKGIEISEASNGETALKIIENQVIKAIITDIKMTGMSGIEFVAKVRGQGFNVPVIFLSGHADKDYAIEALRLRAFDFIEKQVQSERLLLSVRRAISDNDLDFLPRLQSLNLSSTRINIIDMLVKGLSNKEIADRMRLSEQGVKYHISKLFKRFDSSNRNELRGKILKIVNV